jgi:hypothetical protein
MRTPVGGTIATIYKDRDLPNVFGRADLFPIINTPTQPAVLSSRESGMAYGTSRTLRVASPADQVAMSIPGAAKFSVPKQTSLTLPTGQTVEFIAAESHQLTYRIVEQGM